MHRFKFPVGPSVIMLVLLGITMMVNVPKTITLSKEVITAEKTQKLLASQKEESLYLLQQRELQTAVKAYFDKAIASGDIVGAGVCIVKGDSIVISGGFGKRDINQNGEVNEQTIFRLGSLSKGFTGILAANLKSEGKLGWEDKVTDYIPEFSLGDRNNTDKITLTHLLSHSSGAPYHSYTNLVEAGLPLMDITKRFKNVKPISNPGLIYSYQNALFALSGEMMYKATGQSFNSSLAEKFFNPLEMCSTITDHETLLNAENVALPHTKKRYGWRSRKLSNRYYNAVAAGGINASTEDMAKWIRFILGHNPEIMSRSTIEEAFTPYVEIKGRSKYYQRWPGHLSSHYGLGWRIHKFVENTTEQEMTIWHHGGSVNNYRNEIAIYPESDLGICVLFNNNARLAKTVVPDLYKIVQRIYEQNTAKVAFNPLPDQLESLTPSASIQ